MNRQFLYRIRPSRIAMLTEGPTSREEGIVSRHFTYLEGLTERGVVLLAARTLHPDETAFGIVIFLAESEEEARGIMENDPAVVEGVMLADLFPLRIALAARDWTGALAPPE